MPSRNKKSQGFQQILARVAKTSEEPQEKVEKDLQSLLDATWNNETNPAKENLRALFPNGKPTLEEFVLGLASQVKKMS